jgi:hypothetical protein
VRIEGIWGFIEQSLSSEANRSSVNQEIHYILWNPKFHYSIHKSSPPVSRPEPDNPVHVSPSKFLETHFNSILPFTSRSFKFSPTANRDKIFFSVVQPAPQSLYLLSYPLS